MIEEMKVKHLAQPLGTVEGTVGIQKAGSLDWAERVVPVELGNGQQLTAGGVVALGGDIVQVEASEREVEFRILACKYLESVTRGVIVIDINDGVADGRGRRELAEEMGNGLGDVAQDEPGVWRQEARQFLEISEIIAFLIEIGVITIIAWRRQAAPGVKAVEIDGDSRGNGRLLGNPGHVHETGAAGDAKFQYRNGLETEGRSLPRGLENAVGVMGPKNQIEPDSGFKGAEGQDEERGDIEVKRLGKALVEDAFPDITVSQLTGEGHGERFFGRGDD